MVRALRGPRRSLLDTRFELHAYGGSWSSGILVIIKSAGSTCWRSTGTVSCMPRAKL